MSKLFPKRVVWHHRVTFHALIVPRACRVELLGDISCLYCSPSVSCDTLGRHFMPLSFPKRAVWNSWATFHAFIVPRACRVTPLSDILYHYRSSRVLPDTLGGTFHVKIVSQACRVTPSGDISCLNCSPGVSYGTLGRRFMPLSFPKRAVRNP